MSWGSDMYDLSYQSEVRDHRRGARLGLTLFRRSVAIVLLIITRSSSTHYCFTSLL